MNEKYIELAKKLNRLSEESSFEGERTSAKVQLDRLMKKRGVTKDDLIEDKISWHLFKFDLKYKQLFIQVILSVSGGQTDMWMNKKRKTIIELKITKSQAIEIEMRFNHFKALFKKEEKTLFGAFLNKHNLFDSNSKGKSFDDLSDEEKEESIRAYNMSKSLHDSDLLKQIKNKNTLDV